jgi:hypothetical protein
VKKTKIQTSPPNVEEIEVFLKNFEEKKETALNEKIDKKWEEFQTRFLEEFRRQQEEVQEKTNSKKKSSKIETVKPTKVQRREINDYIDKHWTSDWFNSTPDIAKTQLAEKYPSLKTQVRKKFFKLNPSNKISFKNRLESLFQIERAITFTL